MRKIVLIPFLLAAFLMLAASPTHAFFGMKGNLFSGNGSREFLKMKIIKDLDLTRQQKEAIMGKQQELDRDILPLRQNVENAMFDMEQELSADKPDNAKIDSLIDNISKNSTDMQKKKIAFVLWARTQLTDGQKKKMASLIKDMKDQKARNREKRDLNGRKNG